MAPTCVCVCARERLNLHLRSPQTKRRCCCHRFISLFPSIFCCAFHTLFGTIFSVRCLARGILFSTKRKMLAFSIVRSSTTLFLAERIHRYQCCLWRLHVWKRECREHNDIYLPYDLRNCSFSVHSLSCSLAGARRSLACSVPELI